MKFTIGQEVRELASGYECIVGATKAIPLKHPSSGEDIYPSGYNDYIIYIKKSDGNYSGTMEVPEQNLKLID